MAQEQLREKQVLLVDDDPAVRMLWDRFLERWGFAFDLAENGQQGLDLARRTRYQVVITDLAMPGLPGVEMIKQLKHEQPELAIIVITGHGTVEVAVETMKAGAYEFITKPINFNHAEMVVRKCMEQIVARRENLRLRQINRDLEALNVIKEKFIAITNHELRTPVSVINNIAEILQGELANSQVAPMLFMLSRSARHLTEIVAQMHEISRIKSDKLILEPTMFDLAPLCREVEEELFLALQRRGHHITWEVSEHLFIKADRVKLKKVVRELLNNAIKFTQDSGRITVAAHRDEQDGLVVNVSDNGIGIADENLDCIFQLFYEVGEPIHHHTSREDFLGGGMGVGLSIVKDIVEAHGGKVSVGSVVGRGSTFTLTLPAAVPQEAERGVERAYG